MIGWFLDAIGISDSLVSGSGELQWMWSRPTLLWIGLALLVPIAAFVILRHERSLSQIPLWARGMLSFCRIGVLLLLVLVLAGPYLRLQDEQERQPTLAVLVDRSASMQLPSGTFEDQMLSRLARAAGQSASADGPIAPETRQAMEALTRAGLLDAVLKREDDRTFRELRDRFDIRYFDFARGLTPADAAVSPAASGEASADGKTDGLLEQVPANRRDTAIGYAVDAALEETSDRNLSAIVLFSDGRSTSGGDPVELIQARLRSRTDTPPPPIITVPVGSPKPLRDAAVVDALAPSQVGEGDAIPVIATLESFGYTGQVARVELLLDGLRVDEQTITLDDAERPQIELRLPTSDVGSILLEVRLQALEGEAVSENNTFEVLVEVTDDKVKVLYIEGTPRWDFRFLDHGFRRDKALDVKMVMESYLAARAGEDQSLPALAGLPETPEELAEYNVILLGDASPAMLTPQFIEMINQVVREDGVGLIVQAGPVAMPHAHSDTPLVDLLPITLSGPGRQAPAYAPFRMQVTAPGAMHTSMRLYDSVSRSRSLWEQMPAFYWAVGSDQSRPAATVLAEYSSEEDAAAHPLIAEQIVGAGRVVLIGTDETYRWRKSIGSHLFYRFWGQLLRHVARSDDRPTDATWIDATPQRVEPGDPVSIELHAVDHAAMPLQASEVAVELVKDGTTTEAIMLRSQGGSAGYYHATWQPAEPAHYELRYTDPGGKQVSAGVDVTPTVRELRRPVVDRNTLGALADASGGGYLELDQLSMLPELIQGETVTVSRSEEQEVWDNWFVLLVLASLYCLDVGIRRWMGLT